MNRREGRLLRRGGSAPAAGDLFLERRGLPPSLVVVLFPKLLRGDFLCLLGARVGRSARRRGHEGDHPRGQWVPDWEERKGVHRGGSAPAGGTAHRLTTGLLNSLTKDVQVAAPIRILLRIDDGEHDAAECSLEHRVTEGVEHVLDDDLGLVAECSAAPCPEDNLVIAALQRRPEHSMDALIDGASVSICAVPELPILPAQVGHRRGDDRTLLVFRPVRDDVVV